MTPIAHTAPKGQTQPHDLYAHLQAVARLARSFAEPFHAGDWAELAGWWHDLGKYRPQFQEYLQGRRQKGHDTSHKLAGAALALELNPRHPAAGLVALCIAGHHGGLPAFCDETGGLQSRLDRAKQELGEARTGGAPEDLLRHRLAPPPTALVIPKEDQLVFLELLTRLLFSALVDADWTDTAAFTSPSPPPGPVPSLAELQHRIDQECDSLCARAADSLVNRHRREVLEACRLAADRPVGIHELTVPTGGGKTLAAMSFALRHAVRHDLRRVVVVLPYTSIIEQNAQVYRRILGDAAVLEHHSNLDLDQELVRQAGMDQDQVWRAWKLRAETWDAPVIVTTSVQFLETLHADQPSRLRKLHRLARSVVILDECQNLPVGLLDATLATLRTASRAFGISLVTCTATQPALRPTSVLGRAQPRLGEARPIIADPRPMFAVLKRVEVRWPADPAVPTTWPDLARELADQSQVLAIVHRRRDARELTQALDAVLGTSDTVHLSAQMIPAHRSRVLDEVRQKLKAGLPCRVVATTLVEAGVDIDLPVVYRCLGGIDGLIQAAGRCNREGRQTAGSFRIFRAPTEPPKGLKTGLDITLGFLRQSADNRLDLDDPDLPRRFFQELYGGQNTDSLGIQSLRQGIRSAFPAIARAYQVIDANDQVAVVVPWPGLDSATLDAINRLRHGHATAQDYRRCQRASATLPRRIVATWLARRVVSMTSDHPVPVLDLTGQEWMYDQRFGLSAEADPEPPVESLVL